MPGYELCPSPRIPSCLPSKAHLLRGALLDHSGYIAAPSQTFGTPTSSDIHLDMWTSQCVLWLHLDHSARLDTPIGYKSNRLPSSAPPLSYTKHRTLHAVSPQKWIMTVLEMQEDAPLDCYPTLCVHRSLSAALRSRPRLLLKGAGDSDKARTSANQFRQWRPGVKARSFLCSGSTLGDRARPRINVFRPLGLAPQKVWWPT